MGEGRVRTEDGRHARFRGGVHKCLKEHKRAPWAHMGSLGCIHKPKGTYMSPNALSHLEFDIIWLEMHVLEVQIIFKVRM
jgi:hypothetical protein